MSVYPKFNTNTNLFNSKNIISQEENTNGSSVVTLDLSSFVQRNAPVFDNELYLKEGVSINMNGVKQTDAFDDVKKTELETTKLKTSAITYDSNNARTVLSNNVDLTTANVEYADESIAQNKITGLVTRLEGIDTNLSNINSNDADILNLNNITETHKNRLDAIDTLNEAQDTRLTTNETEIENIKLNITTIEGDVSANLGSINDNNTNIQANIASINTLNNEVINLRSKDVEIETNVASNLTSLNAYKVSNDLSINQINTKIDNNTSNISVNTASIITINTLNVAQNTRLDAIETLNTTQDTRLDAIETLNTAQDVSINVLETSTSTNTNNIISLQSLTTSHTNSITTLQSNIEANDGDILTLQNEMLTKQPIINNLNKLNTSFIGNGDVSNDKLSSLNDIRTDVSIQNQLNTISSNLSALDALQDIDLINIPQLQTDVTNLKAKDVVIDSSLNALITNTQTNTSNIATNTSNIATNTSNIATNSNTISNINNSLTTLTNADTLHTSQITDLQTADTTLQNNINLKQNQINVNNKLNTNVIYDVSMNNTLNNLLETLDTNINVLDTTKQTKITATNKLQSSLLNRNDNLAYVDVTSSIQSSLDTINSSINLLQGTDTTIIQDIQSNFDTVDASLSSLNISIINNKNAISTLQGLQDGDVISFQNINNSITNLTNTKHPLIDVNNKLNSSLINRNDNLQYVDISSSLVSQLTTLQNNIDLKQNQINDTTKLSISKVDLSGSTLINADYGSSINSKFTSLDSQISTLNATDVSQLSTNTSFQNQLNTLQNKDTQIDASLSSIITNISTLQTNIDNINASKIEDIGTHTYDNSINKITHTYDEKTMFIDTLDDNQLMTLDLILNSPVNGKNYVQNIIINCEQFKSYIQTLNINGNPVTILHKGGDNAINLAPIAGYSAIIQYLQILRANDEWLVTSNIFLHYNSVTNVTYDETAPVINLLGDQNMNIEINSSPYVEPGYTCVDNVDGDISNNVVVSGTVDYTTLGVFNITYNVSDAKGNQAIEKIRTINVVDTTNPVVTLIGDASIDIQLGSSYTEQGATANDNSNETLTVVIGGDTVNTNVEGTYVVTYTAYDSTGNSHQISRSVNVISLYTLTWTNGEATYIESPSVLSVRAKINNTSTWQPFSSSGIAGIDGNYVIQTSNNSGVYDRQWLFAFNDGGASTANIYNGTGEKFYHHIHGNVTVSSPSYGTDGTYLGTKTNVVNWTDSQVSSGGTYTGSFIMFHYPRFYHLKRLMIYTMRVKEFAVLGSVDNVTFTDMLVELNVTNGVNLDSNLSAHTGKYKYIKIVFMKGHDALLSLSKIRTYGDFYV